MSRWNAPSDFDYHDEPWKHAGIERHCAECGAVVYVDADEEYQVRVTCGRCDEQASKALDAQTPKDAA